MKLTVSLFIWLLHTFDAFYQVLRADRFNIHGGCVAQQPQHRRLSAEPGVDLNIILIGQLMGERLHLGGGSAGLQHDNHTKHTFQR